MSLRNRLERLERRQATTTSGFVGSGKWWTALAGDRSGLTADEQAEFDKVFADLGPYRDTLAEKIAAVRDGQPLPGD